MTHSRKLTRRLLSRSPSPSGQERDTRGRPVMGSASPSRVGACVHPRLDRCRGARLTAARKADQPAAAARAAAALERERARRAHNRRHESHHRALPRRSQGRSLQPPRRWCSDKRRCRVRAAECRRGGRRRGGRRGIHTLRRPARVRWSHKGYSLLFSPSPPLRTHRCRISRLERLGPVIRPRRQTA